MKRKVCRTCKIFVEKDLCPVCKKSSFSTNWQGLVTILDAKNSKIAEHMGFKVQGDYCIKVR
jgi:RNA polymerase subunit RPABC4/transcription elongation factor Spt4